MLQLVFEYNMQAAEALYAELAGPVGPEVSADASTAVKGKAFVALLIALMDASGVPRRLRDAGVDEKMLPQLAADAMLQTRLLGNNPVDVTEADALALYHAAL